MTAVGQKGGVVVFKILVGSNPSLDEAVIDELAPALASKIEGVNSVKISCSRKVIDLLGCQTC